MAFAKVTMTNGIEIKQVPLGFSWTTFFWGGWPAIFRQDWLWGILLILGCIFTYGVAGIVCSFFYNKNYAKRLFEQGYHLQTPLPAGVSEEQIRVYLNYVKLPERTGTVA
jgi:hypothetical protein